MLSTIARVLLMIVLVSGTQLRSETPQGMNYQAVARTSQGALISNENVEVRFSIHQGSALGPVIYQETSSSKTNEFGLFSVVLGRGTAVGPSFNTIDWSNGTKFLQVEFKANGGSYVDMGSQELLSSAYAFNSQSSNGLSKGVKLSPSVLEGNGATSGQVLAWDGSNWVPSYGVKTDTGVTVQSNKTLAGDVTGPIASNTVEKIQGKSVSSANPSNGQILQWNGSAWTPSSMSVTLNGDATGSSSSNTVTKIQGNSVANTAPSNGQILQWNGSAWTPSTMAVTLGGDATGSSASNTVTKLQGKNVSSAAPANGQFLQWDGTAWTPTNLALTLGGDVTGSLAANTVTKLQGKSVSNTAPTSGQVLSWDGSAWTPSTPAAGGGSGIKLPLDTTMSTTSTMLRMVNSNMNNTNAGLAVWMSGKGPAAWFYSPTATNTLEVERVYQGGLGVGLISQVVNTSNSAAAVKGETNGSGYGLQGVATGNGNAANFTIANPSSTSSIVTAATNGIGSGLTVQMTNASNGARGIDVLQTGVGPGVFASSAGGNAVWGITSSISAAGVIGDNTFGEAVVGRNRGGNGVGAVVGRNDSSGYGVRGFNTKDGYGVLGQAGISGGTGVGGRFENVNAANTNDACQVATNGNANGLKVTSTNGTISTGKAAILATTTDGTAISGITNGTSTSDAGIRGTATNANAYAAYFSGKVHIAGTLSKTAGTFKIDHPLDPANKYLVHSFVESPDMMNVYNGNITTDANGRAIVSLPAYFEAENINFKYQLTVIGQFAQAIVMKEISNNQFEIMTDKPNVKVSWQVTGVRNDVFAQQNRFVDVVEKEKENKGFYVYPQGYGLPLSKGIYSKGIEQSLQNNDATAVPAAKTASDNSLNTQEIRSQK